MNKTVAIVGGSGFIGRALASHLAHGAARVRIITRNRKHARALWPLPDVEIVEIANYNRSHLASSLDGVDGVVNLAGILNERGDNGTGFRSVHVDLVRHLVEACRSSRIRNLIHLSALNADSFAESYYLRTKGEAEKLLADAASRDFGVTIIRPSVVFGREDKFTNRFAQILRLCPHVLPLACAHAKLQPLHVNDLIAAMSVLLNERVAGVRRIDLGGPEVLELADCVRLVANAMGRPTVVAPLPAIISAMQANFLEYVPGKPFSRDNLRALGIDSVCLQTNGFSNLDIRPKPMSEIVPGYLAPSDSRHRLYEYRAKQGAS